MNTFHDKETTEEKLRRSEERHRSLIEGLQDNFFFYTHNIYGIFTYLSPSITNVLGYSQDEFLTHYSAYMTKNTENECVIRRTDQSIKGIKQPPYEVEIYHKNGSIRTLKVQEVPVFDKNKNVIAVEGIAEDITDRKQTEELFLLYGRVLENLAEGVCFVKAGDRRIVYTNMQCDRMFGYRQEELIGKHISVLSATGEKSFEQDAEGMYGQLKKQGRWTGEQYNRKKTGNTFWSKVNVSLFRHPMYGDVWVSVYEDITEQKKALMALQKTEAQYRTLLESLPLRIFYKDSSLKYVSCNKNFAQDLGIEQDKIKGKTDFDLYPKKMADKIRNQDRKVLETGKILELQDKYIFHDTSEMFIQIMKKPIEDENGKIVGILGFFEDVTEKVLLQQEISRSAQH